jgi:8-oxo-dGTP pyrophosphatase MutT (NUDIX family)
MTDELLCATVTQRGVIVGPATEVVIVQRASDGHWELPGGRIGRGEAASDALRREIREETALSPTIITPVTTRTWINDAGQDRYGVYFYCRTSERTVSLSEEHRDYRWLSPENAAAMLDTPQVRALDAALAEHKDRQSRTETRPPESSE